MPGHICLLQVLFFSVRVSPCKQVHVCKFNRFFFPFPCFTFKATYFPFSKTEWHSLTSKRKLVGFLNSDWTAALAERWYPPTLLKRRHCCLLTDQLLCLSYAWGPTEYSIRNRGLFFTLFSNMWHADFHNHLPKSVIYSNFHY